MDTLLLVVTGVSVVVAIGSAATAWRVVHADRRRTAARVAALAAAAGVSRSAVPEIAAADASLRAEDRSPTSNDVRPGAAVVEAGAIFVRPAVDSGSAGRQHGVLAAAAAAGVLALATVGILFVSGRTSGAGAGAAPTPLELVALSHARADGVLSVQGVVRNPANGRPVDELQAEVRVFDAAGLMISTRATRVDFVEALAPGEDAPFTVPLGEASTAARYRVSFSSHGSMRSHVDRRTNLPAAVTADAR